MATSGLDDEESFHLESSVRGHHVFKSVWTPVVGQLLLQVHAEPRNSHDVYSIAVTLDDAVVGHLPREFSHVAFYFLQHRGHITCEITGSRRLSEVHNKGLVVPCLYTFWGKTAIIKRLVEVMTSRDNKTQFKQ